MSNNQPSVIRTGSDLNANFAVRKDRKKVTSSKTEIEGDEEQYERVCMECVDSFLKTVTCTRSSGQKT
jgi:hypothetical protein